MLHIACEHAPLTPFAVYRSPAPAPPAPAVPYTSGVLLFCGLTLWCVAAVLPANLTSRDIDRLLRQQVGRTGSGKKVVDGRGPWACSGNGWLCATRTLGHSMAKACNWTSAGAMRAPYPAL